MGDGGKGFRCQVSGVRIYADNLLNASRKALSLYLKYDICDYPVRQAESAPLWLHNFSGIWGGRGRGRGRGGGRGRFTALVCAIRARCGRSPGRPHDLLRLSNLLKSVVFYKK